MTIEYILLLIVVFAIGLKSFMIAPRKAFTESGPKLAARVEKQLLTGRSFSANHSFRWEPDRK